MEVGATVGCWQRALNPTLAPIGVSYMGWNPERASVGSFVEDTNDPGNATATARVICESTAVILNSLRFHQVILPLRCVNNIAGRRPVRRRCCRISVGNPPPLTL